MHHYVIHPRKDIPAIFSSVTDGISTAKAAVRLGTTPPTVRRLLESGDLAGERLPRGGRFCWSVDSASVDSYLAQHGEFPGTRSGPRGNSPIAQEVRRLSEEMAALRSLLPPESAEGHLQTLQSERDDLRAKLVSVSESLVRLGSATERQLSADAERAALVEHLLAAVSSAERVDKFRREAFEDLQEALADAQRVGHPASLGT